VIITSLAVVFICQCANSWTIPSTTTEVPPTDGVTMPTIRFDATSTITDDLTSYKSHTSDVSDSTTKSTQTSTDFTTSLPLTSELVTDVAVDRTVLRTIVENLVILKIKVDKDMDSLVANSGISQYNLYTDEVKSQRPRLPDNIADMAKQCQYMAVLGAIEETYSQFLPWAQQVKGAVFNALRQTIYTIHTSVHAKEHTSSTPSPTSSTDSDDIYEILKTLAALSYQNNDATNAVFDLYRCSA
ncbi:hypothetical protein MAR_008965, partial [Mya arenaria]